MIDRLSKEIIDQVVFGMENQERDYYLDVEDGVVVSDEEIPEEADADRFEPVPPWRSVDGYNLMERFVGSLHNPIYRERLRLILASGRGVFRQFKDALKERPEIERLWYSFKEREMRQLVSEWYNDVREQRGLERMELEDSETDQLIATDFVIADASAAQGELIAELDWKGFAECYPEADTETVELKYRFRRSSLPRPDDSQSRVIAAETPAGDFAGFVWAVILEANAVRLAVVVQLYVIEEFRGLGRAKALLRSFFDRSAREGVSELIIEMPGRSGVLASSLEQEGLAGEHVAMRLDPARWVRDNHGV